MKNWTNLREQELPWEENAMRNHHQKNTTKGENQEKSSSEETKRYESPRVGEQSVKNRTKLIWIFVSHLNFISSH